MSTTPSVPYRSSRWPARFFIITGIGHTIVGILMDSVRIPFAQALQDGYINQISLSVERRYSYWFFMAGLNFVIIGKLMDWYLFPTPFSAIDDATRANKGESQSLKERRHQRNNVHSERELPRELGYWLLGIGVIGALAIPKSGSYLLGLQGLAIILSK